MQIICFSLKFHDLISYIIIKTLVLHIIVHIILQQTKNITHLMQFKMNIINQDS